MQDPKEFYIAEKEKFENEFQTLKKQSATLSTLRLLVFLATAFGIYFSFSNTVIAIIIAFLGIGLFLFLIIKHTALHDKKNLCDKLITLNQTEIEVLKGNYQNLENGAEYINPQHHYSFDIDLFGKGSFFQYLNRTASLEGKENLVQWLCENNILKIEEKQKSTIELAKHPKWRQLYTATSSLTQVQFPVKDTVSWIQNYKNAIPAFFNYIPSIFTALSVILIALVSFDKIAPAALVVWFLLGLGISSIYLKKVNAIYQNSDKAKATFKQYFKLLQQIEGAHFKTELLKQKQEAIQLKQEKASDIFYKFSKILDALDQRNNLLIAVLGNGFLLRDLYQAKKVENWIHTYHNKVEKWFEVIAYFDAKNSMANYAFNHPQSVFPEIDHGTHLIQAKNLGHPLIDVNERIDNNFSIDKKQFFIITGANMAGKSTFLRTVSLGIVMANMGLPVCAENFVYVPIKLITSMRATDSLAEDTSYFFSELKRLKFIVDEIKTENYFIILDEILKGTNSTDKAIGSKKFVQKLVASESTGIIATHDLSLCEIEKELPQIKNYYFDAEIINNELHFDYHLKSGICKNMNASFLLKKMEIV